MSILLSENLPQLFAGALVALYAWKRYGTPSSNRSSTTRAQFYFTCCAYVVCGLSLFILLNSLLTRPGALEFMTFGAPLPPEANELGKLSISFLSALFLTTLLPSIPFLSEIDSALLKFFQHLGSIPIEVRRLKRDLKQMDYKPPQTSLNLARDFLGAHPKILAAHLAADQGTSVQHRFTRAICLYCELKDLDDNSGFLKDFVDETDELEKLIELVCAQAGAYFTFAATPGVADGALDDARAAFEKACDAADNKICCLFARGLLSASWFGNKLRQRMINLGFRLVGAHPPFILNLALTAGLIVFAVFVSGMFVMRAVAGEGSDWSITRHVTLAIVIGINYGIAATLAIAPKSKWSFARRTAEHGKSVFAYVLSAGLTGLAAMSVGLVHTIAWEETIGAGVDRYFSVAYVWILPPVVVALMLAFLSDNYALAKSEPRWLRWVEGAVMGCAVAASTFIASEWFKDLARRIEEPVPGVPADALPLPVYAAILVGISVAIGMTLGTLVPHAYRKARRAEDNPPAPAPAPVPLQPVAVQSVAVQSVAVANG